jgi:hypothetical protein
MRYVVFAPLHVTYLGHEPPHLLLGGVVTQGSQAAPAGQLFREVSYVGFSKSQEKVTNLKINMF